MTQFPSSIISFSTKVNGQVIDASDIDIPQNEITALETKVGIDNSSIVTSLDYLVKNPLSTGGGHIQSANLGGTGQTNFVKGDILVASSSSVLSKLSVGLNGTVPTADSTASAGLSYQAVATAQTIQNQTNTYARASVVSASVYGVILNTPVSVLSDGLGLVIKFPTTNTTSVLALSFPFGQSSVTARLKNTDLTNPIVGAIQASMIGIVEFDSVSSVFQLQNTYVPTYGTDTTKFLRNDATWGTATSYKTFTGTRASNATGGAVTYAHGLGKTPLFVDLSATYRHTANTQNISTSVGGYDGTTNTSAYFTALWASAGVAGSSSSNGISVYEDGSISNGQTGVITVDATNVTITWTKVGAASGDNIQLFFKVSG